MSTYNTTEILAGGAVLAAAIAFVVYAGQATGLASPAAGTTLNASFRSLEGVQIGTDVRLAGVKIGTVSDVTLNPDTFRADTELSLRSDVELPDDSAAVISSEGLLGGNFVEILPGGSPFAYADGDEVIDTQGAVSLVQLMMRFVAGDGE